MSDKLKSVKQSDYSPEYLTSTSKRLLKKVKLSEARVTWMPDKCWLWTGASSPKGYGYLGLGSNGRSMIAHKVAYLIWRGDIIDRMVDHMCHVPSCVNPAHLRLLTNSENQQHRKGVASNSATGYRNVRHDKRNGKYPVYFKINGKQIFIGQWSTAEEANEHAVKWRAEHYRYSDFDRRETA